MFFPRIKDFIIRGYPASTTLATIQRRSENTDLVCFYSVDGGMITSQAPPYFQVASATDTVLVMTLTMPTDDWGIHVLGQCVDISDCVGSVSFSSEDLVHWEDG